MIVGTSSSVVDEQILETLLSRLGCRCVCVREGPDALAVTGNLSEYCPLCGGVTTVRG